mgnify:CR=1 FL=1
MVYDKGLHKLHPLACIELKDLNEHFLQQDVRGAFTRGFH